MINQFTNMLGPNTKQAICFKKLGFFNSLYLEI